MVLNENKQTKSVLSLGNNVISTFRDDRILGGYSKDRGMSTF